MYFIQGEEMENKTTYQNNTKFENFPSTNNNKNGENKMDQEMKLLSQIRNYLDKKNDGLSFEEFQQKKEQA